MKSSRTTQLLTGTSMIGLLCAATSTHAQQIMTNISVPGYCISVAVNPALNKVYLSGGASAAQPVVVVDGLAFTDLSAGAGMGADVDITNNTYWSAGVYSGNVTVWSSNNSALATVPLITCPIEVSVDAPHRRVWAGAQCNDAVWAINADTYVVIAGPISPGGVMGGLVVTPATDRAYFMSSGGSKRVNPATFAVTANAFGPVVGVNASANRLYVVGSGGALQIMDGGADPETVLATVNLPCALTGYQIGVNPVLNRVYVQQSTNIVAILNGTTGASIGTVVLPGITTVGNMSVDASRNRVYALAYASGAAYLYVIQDNPPAPAFRSATYLGTAGADVRGTGIKASGGAVYVCGNSTVSSGLIASFPGPLVSAGAPVWEAAWPDTNPSDQFYGIAASSAGLYLGSADYTRTTDIVGGKEGKGLILKFPFAGPTGNGYGGDLWDRQTPPPPGAYGYGGGENLIGVTVASENGVNYIYTTGNGQPNGMINGAFWMAKLAEDSTLLWTQTQATPGRDNSAGVAIVALNTNCYAAGFYNTNATGLLYPALWKYTSSGTPAWMRIGNNAGAYNGIATVGNSLYAVGGRGPGASTWYANPGAASDFLVEKWDESGNQVWSRTYSRGAQSVLTAAVSVNGRLFASGYTRGQTAGGADAVLVELDPTTGNLLSTAVSGGSLDDMANALDSDGTELYLVGESRSFGSGSDQVMVLDYSLAPMVTNLVVAPASPIIGTGTNQAFSVTGYFSDGSIGGLVGSSVSWSSSNLGVASISTNGVATGLSSGVTTIGATCNNLSANALLTVVVTPAISTNPISTTVCSGGTVTLSAAASGGDLSYQWAFNGVNLAGATNATLTLSNFSAANVGDYTLTVSNPAGTVTSHAASLASADIKMFAGVVVDGPLGSNYRKR